jgi:hypothetical protein
MDAIRQPSMRKAAFDHIRRLQSVHDQLTAADLAKGFAFDGQRFPLVNPQRGIFKPKEMEHLLSIRTVFPKPGARVWYDDQREVHGQIYSGQETIDYAFMGTNADVAENRWLREAMEQKTPIIYFLGVSPGRYEAVMPAFIVHWDAVACKAGGRVRRRCHRRGRHTTCRCRGATLRSSHGAAATASSDVPRRCHYRIPRPLRAVRPPRTFAARCRSHRGGQERTAGATSGAERHSAVEDPPRGVRRSPDWH